MDSVRKGCVDESGQCSNRKSAPKFGLCETKPDRWGDLGHHGTPSMGSCVV